MTWFSGTVTRATRVTDFVYVNVTRMTDSVCVNVTRATRLTDSVYCIKFKMDIPVFGSKGYQA